MYSTLHRYHDWYILNVETDINKEYLRLIFTDIEKREYLAIQFLDVKRCRIDNFTIGNIVNSICVFSGEGSTALLKEDESYRSLFSCERESELLTKYLEEIENSEKIFVEISPSYGCNLVLICSRIIEETGKHCFNFENTRDML